MYSNGESADQRRFRIGSCYFIDRNSYPAKNVSKLVQRNSHRQLVLLSVLLIVTLSHFPSTSAFCDKATSSFSRGLTYCIDATKKATSVVEDWCRAETQNNKAFQTCMLEKVIARKALDTKVLEDQAHTRAVLTQLHHDLLPIRLAAMERAKVAQAKKGGNGRDEINFNELVDYSSKIITEVGYVLERFGGHTPIVAVPAVGPAKTENDATRKQNNWKALQNYLNMVQYAYDALFFLEKKYCS